MDTNQNIHINSFTKGMNSDTSYDMVGADQYLFGQNIRITNNTVIAQAVNANTTEGIVTPVPDGNPVEVIGMLSSVSSILATASIGNVGAIVIKHVNNTWSIYRANHNGSSIKLSHVFTSSTKVSDGIENFSVVINDEIKIGDKKLLKLYIADGEHPVMQVDLYTDYGDDHDIDHLMSNRIFPLKRVLFQSKISGKLKTQQVQYTYRYYKKYGICSKLAIVTPKIQVIDGNRHKEQGNAEDTETSIGFKLRIEDVNQYTNIFDHIQIFRLSYIKPHENAEVHLICDQIIPTDAETFDYDDYGAESLAEYSIEEFSALNSQTISPKIIEQNQGYLFAANSNDSTVIRLETTDTKPWLTKVDTDVTFNVDLDLTNIGTKFVPSKVTDDKVVNYFKSKCVVIKKDKQELTYNDMYVSSLCRSLRRGEKYKYGVVYYDTHGNRSNVVGFTEIQTPRSSNCTINSDNVLQTTPIGVQFKVTRPTKKQADDREIVAYQIVRCEKSDQYSTNLLQVALSRPLRQGRYGDVNYRTPWYPGTFLTTQFMYTLYSRTGADANEMDDNAGMNGEHIQNGNTHDMWTGYIDRSGTNVENFHLFQAFSPEINVVRNDTLSRLSVSDTKLSPLSFIYDNRTLAEISKVAAAGNDNSYTHALSEHKPVSLHAIFGDAYNDQHKCFIPLYDQNDSTKGYNCWFSVLTLPINSALSYMFNRDKIKQHQTTTAYDMSDGIYIYQKLHMSYKIGNKTQSNLVCKYYTTSEVSKANEKDINNISDVKNPNWENGFSQVELNADGYTVGRAIKQYESYSSTIGSDTYVNWSANGMYNLAATKDEGIMQNGNGRTNYYVFVNDERLEDYTQQGCIGRFGWIGPGPVCFLLDVEGVTQNNSCLGTHIYTTKKNQDNSYDSYLGTIIANITHTPLEYDEKNKYDTYYGFGNYGVFNKDENGNYETVSMITVYDGDAYVTPSEHVNLFKTYDFNDKPFSLMSGQVVCYIPLESRINTYFDYGENYRNTSSTNLQLEPGTIEGITTQDRPLHQYNMIYSDNDTSNDVFAPQIQEEEATAFTQRIHYSQLKTNGESIDNWQIFKPVNFIDADTRYGQITNLLKSNDVLYYWQEQAFGKLSVNERSLVKDENSNTIQLGQGGVLQRTDYLSTQYGMREQDYAAIAVQNNVYWIDRDNKAIVAYNQGVANFGEIMNVQNVVNEYFDDVRRPTIEYDLQNYELVCNFLTRKDPESRDKNLELVFNLKLNCATSVYTRDYDNHIYFNNKLFGLKLGDELSAKQYNYLESDYEPTYSPVMLSFSVNSNASQTKVFDNQKIVLVNGPGQLDETSEDMLITKAGMNVFAALKGYKMSDYVYHSRVPFLATKQFSFTTDMDSTEQDPEMYTDRENNICYALPRLGSADYGDRLRGKWLKVDIVDDKPTELLAISHIITSVRKSYS